MGKKNWTAKRVAAWAIIAATAVLLFPLTLAAGLCWLIDRAFKFVKANA
jgi:hypothetical protein